jgi:hypothetical protein
MEFANSMIRASCELLYTFISSDFGNRLLSHEETAPGDAGVRCGAAQRRPSL